MQRATHRSRLRSALVLDQFVARVAASTRSKLRGSDAAVLRPVVVTVVAFAIDDFLDEPVLGDEGALAVVGNGLVAGDVLDDDDAEPPSDAFAKLRDRRNLLPVWFVGD